MQRALVLFAALFGLAQCSPTPSGPQKRAPIASVEYLGLTTSNLPNEYRDGGGGGAINGLNFIMFSDGIYTSGGVPQDSKSNWANFTSNSIACSGCSGAAITTLQDFGTTAKGPYQIVPLVNDETQGNTGVWPNQNMVTLCNGACGVSFPAVVNRSAISAGSSDVTMYNTGVEITLTGYGPVASRPTQKLFLGSEPQYGTFSSLTGIDGYIYMFAAVSNGLKLARVPQSAWSDRSQYRYWDGASYANTVPSINDGGASNVFTWTEDLFDTLYGPNSGDVFYNRYYGIYMVIFQSAAPALDQSVYMSYSSEMTGGWSTPVSIYQTPTISDGYSYSFHAYPNYDSTQRVVPVSWATYSESQSFSIGMANITFS